MEERNVEDLTPGELKQILDGTLLRKNGNKYGAKKTEIDGYVFDSKREAEFYAELKIREKAGEITHLELQPRFDCIVNGRHICSYVADFRFQEGVKKDGDFLVRDMRVVDVKGVKTPVYRIKKKLCEALFNITILEVT